MVEWNKRFAASAMAIAIISASSLAARQPAEGSANALQSDGEEVPIEQQGFVDESFDGGADGPTPDPSDQEVIGQTARPSHETLSGIEVEGLSTHSIPLTRLRGTSTFSDSLPVGLVDIALAVPGNMTKRDSTYCTATLVDVDVVMTAYHCFPGTTSSYRKKGFEARGASVTFGYYDEAASEITAKVKRVIDADQELDFAILELDSSPGSTLGYVNVSLEPVGDRQLRMFHHPYGYYKMVLQDATCRTVRPRNGAASRLYHQCDTRGGSSGAAILGYDLSDDGQKRRPIAYGVHISGRAKGLSDASRHFNVAVPMTAIANRSEFIRKIACQATLVGLECPDRSFIRPTVVHFDWDQAALNAEAVSRLTKLVDALKNAPGNFRFTSISVSGFAEDMPGISSEYEQAISNRRANAVADYLALQDLSIPINSYARGSQGAPSGRDSHMRRVEIKIDYEYLWN